MSVAIGTTNGQLVSGTNNVFVDIAYYDHFSSKLTLYIRTGGTNLEKVEKIIKSAPNMSNLEYNEAFIWSIRKGDLNLIKYMSKLPNVNVNTKNNKAIIVASTVGNLDVIKYLVTLPGVDVTAQNNRAIAEVFKTNKFHVIDFLLTLPGVDPTANNNLIMLDILGRTCDSENCLTKSAILLYWVPSIKQTLHVDDYKRYHTRQCRSIVPYVHKIATIFTELPTPLIIEIIEQFLDQCIYIPYHIKWNMVVKIKHWKPYVEMEDKGVSL